MILHGHKKKILKEVIRYFVETTDSKYDDFILILNKINGKQESELEYTEWLAKKSYEFLKQHEITIQDCIENKDVINATINEDSSRNEGEFFTPNIWAEDGREYLQKMLGDQWGQAYVWDASCYSMDTEILTNRGWVTYDELRDDDLVYALNPETLQGEFVGFHNRFKKNVDEELVHFETRYLDLLVTKDHSVFVKKPSRRGKTFSYEFMSASDAYSYVSSTPSGEHRLSIPVGARLESLKKTDTYSPKKGFFWSFIGFYIGDGFVAEDKGITSCGKIKFTLSKDRKIEYLQGVLKNLGVDYSFYDYRDKDGTVQFWIYDEHLLNYVVNNGLQGSENKFIPYQDITTEYYSDLLEGLLNSDGSVDVSGSIDYTTVSERLANDIESLLQVMGYSVKLSLKESSYVKDDGTKGRKLYRVRGSSLQENNVGFNHVTLEHYQGYVWDITLDKYHVFKVRRNGKSSFSGNCGTGNLMRTSNYPQDKLFLSSLLSEDIEIIKATPEYQGAEAFQLDFLNEIDWDSNNMRFSEKLPPRLRQVLENNEPLVFMMNPPYKVMEANSSDVGGYMASQGMARCALDIFHQFMYRLIMLKRTYKLTNVYLGIFGPVTMFHSTMIEPLYEEFKSEFKFVDGMCFDAGDFSNTSESVGWVVGYTTWRTRQAGEEDKSIVLEAKAIGDNDQPIVIGQRLITSVTTNINTWVAAQDVMRYDQHLPVISTFKTFSGSMMKVPDNFLGYIMSSNYVIRATRRAAVASLPTPENLPITPENFWRCVASFTARRCYASKQTPYNNCQYYSKPDTSVEGYEQWLMDALVVFLFDYSVHFASYRNLEVGDQTFNLSNKMFPIRQDILKQVITDPVLLEDMEKYPAQNDFILSILEQVQGKFSPEAQEFYAFCMELIVESLSGTARADYDYQNWTNAWDAGLLQIREVSGLVSEEKNERYSYLLSKLKHKLFEGIYKFGFLMDAAYVVEDDLSTDEQEEEGEAV